MGIRTRPISRKAPRPAVAEATHCRTNHRRTPYGLEMSESCFACKYRKTGFFCQLSPSELKDFDALKTVTTYPAEAILFLEQERTKGIYMLCEGEVKLSFSSRDGKTLLLKIARGGEVLGLLSALTGNSYEATAQTLRPCQLAFVSSEDFRKLLRRHPNLFQLVADQLGSQYRNACEQLCAVGLGASILERVAHFLLTWSASRGAPQDGLQFTLPLSHEEIGECVGATRESVTRALGEFRNRGLIESHGATLFIRDRAALASVHNGVATPKHAGPRLVRLMQPIRYPAGLGVQNRSWAKRESQRRKA
jgi:CRP/FNR family transcriptional regulator, cyclic AMP receptor protein